MEDVEVVTLDVDLDANPKCTDARCDRDAEWGLKCEGCKGAFLACDPHRAGADHHQAEWAALGASASCATCLHVYPNPLPWRAL